MPPPSISADDSGHLKLKFGAPSEQWVSYIYAATMMVPSVEASADGKGIHVVATFDHSDGDAQLYEGVGLSFLGGNCIDGSGLTGLQFDFDGDLGGRQLEVGVTPSEDIHWTFPPGTCTAGETMCYGPMAAIDPTSGTNFVPFAKLKMGVPLGALDASRILNVQWQLHDAKNPQADFNITNVMFY